MPPLFCSRFCKDLIRWKICKSDCGPNKLFFLLLFLLLSKRKRYSWARFPFGLLLREISRLLITARKGKFAKASSPNKPLFELLFLLQSVYHWYELRLSYDPRSYGRNVCNLHREPWKIQGFNGVWTHDLANTLQCSNQLSYEATEAQSWSFMDSNFPARNESMMKSCMKWTIYWTADMKSSKLRILAVMDAIFAIA